MKKRPLTLLPTLSALLLLCLLPVGCTDEESALGINLVDDNTLYNGQTATLTADRALSVRDDSLVTSNYEYGIIGNYSDPIFGHVSSTLYTQIALAENTSSINLTNNTIDSVVLTLVKSSLYPDTTATYHFHFEVMQLAEPLLSDTNYYSTDSIAVAPGTKYFDNDITVGPTDTVLRLKLDNSIQSILSQAGSAEEFINATKGLRIRMTDAGDEGLLGINFQANKTCLTVYHHYDTLQAVYTFLMGTSTAHFTHIEHDFTGCVTGGADTLDGSSTLYMQPLGGYNILVSFDSAIRSFAADHPTATIHHAELLMPVAASAPAFKPERILALKKIVNGNDAYVNDLLDPYTLGGFDGKYDEQRGCYRLRLTQHVQGMLRDGYDPGTLMVLYARRSNAQTTIINGPATTDPLRIEITYSE